MKLFRSIPLYISALAALAPAGFAQLTNITGTVRDTNGVPYAGGLMKAQLFTTGGSPVTGQPTVTNNNQNQCVSAGMGSAPCQMPFQGTLPQFALSPTGTFAITLQDNTQVTPAATQWLFTISLTPGAPPPLGTGPQVCTSQNTISGANQTLNISTCPNLASGTSGGAGFTGVSAKTANYTAVASDSGKLITVNCAAQCTITLPNPPPSPNWTVAVLNLNASGLNTPALVSPNGLTINGTAASQQFTQFGMTWIYTDGANYFSYGAGSEVGGAIAGGANWLVNNGTNFEIGNYGTGPGPFTWNGGSGNTTVPGFSFVGSLVTASLTSNGGPQTITGCANTASLGGAVAGKFASGTTGTCTVTIALPAATNGWTCDAHDLTTAADANNVVQTAFTTSSATMSGTTVSGDVITWKCMGW